MRNANVDERSQLGSFVPSTGRPILIVDDDLDIREALADTLEDEGFEVVAACNGLEGLKMLRETCPCVILLDLMMPIMNGYQFLEEQAKDAALAAIPVAVITAGGRVDQTRLHQAKVVPKPINVPELLDVVRGLQSSAAATA